MKDKKELKREAMKRVKVVQEILRCWDPIGVEPGTSSPLDEYDSYAPAIVSLVAKGCSVAELARHLGRIRTQELELEASPESDAEFARQFIAELRRTGV